MAKRNPGYDIRTAVPWILDYMDQNKEKGRESFGPDPNAGGLTEAGRGQNAGPMRRVRDIERLIDLSWDDYL